MTARSFGHDDQRSSADSITLDANASVPPLQCAKDALIAAMDLAANPSSPHLLGRRARRLLDDARSAVAQGVGASEKEIFFTSGATESNRWFVDALVAEGARRKRPLRVVTSSIEHASVIKPLRQAAARGALVLDVIDPATQDPFPFPRENTDDVDAVFVTAAHNESGIVVDLDALSARLSDRTILLVDGAQSFARTTRPSSRVDGYSMSAHKIGGFAGSGALFLRRRARALPAPWVGGGQEGGARPGTEALVLTAAFGAAANLIDETRAAHLALARVRDVFESNLDATFSGFSIVGVHCSRLPNTSAVVFHDTDGEALRMATDLAGLCVGFGSACSALAPEPSESLMSLGVSAQDARATVRISFAPGATVDDAARASQQLIEVVRSVRVGAP